jgi:hypothetical protein
MICILSLSIWLEKRYLQFTQWVPMGSHGFPIFKWVTHGRPMQSSATQTPYNTGWTKKNVNIWPLFHCNKGQILTLFLVHPVYIVCWFPFFKAKPLKFSDYWVCKMMSSLFSFDGAYLGMYSTNSQTKYSFGNTKNQAFKKVILQFCQYKKIEKNWCKVVHFFRHMLYLLFFDKKPIKILLNTGMPKREIWGVLCNL